MALQPQYSLLVRDIELEIVPAALDSGVGLLPWSPLAGGWLEDASRRAIELLAREIDWIAEDVRDR